MATALDLITAALVDLNVTAAGEVVPAADALLALTALNRLIDQWAAERLEIYSIARTTWTIVSGTAAYTVGTGGTVNIARPVFVDHVNFIDTSPSPDMEYQLTPLTDDAYSKLPQRDLTSSFPSSYYYNPTYPLGALTFWPVPTSSTLLGAIYAPTAVTQIASLATTVALPPGYSRMIVKNLAVELAPSYARQVDQTLVDQASKAVAIVKRANKRLADLGFDLGALVQGQGGMYAYNIYSGP